MTTERRSSGDSATLAETQSMLGELLRRSSSLGDSTTDPERERLASVVAGNARLTPLEQAEIYREQFWLRHRDSLVDDFPALFYVLGREAFHELARAYLRAHPPSSFTLRDLPLSLPNFADEYEAFAPEQEPLARELCRFELAFITIFDGPSVPPVAADVVAAVPAEAWPSARLRLHPGLRVFALSHPLHELRSAVRRGEEPPRAIEASPTHVALWRGDDLRVHQTELAAAEYALLDALGRGLTLEAACELATTAEDQAEPPVAVWFEGWAKRGWVVGILLADS